MLQLTCFSRLKKFSVQSRFYTEPSSNKNQEFLEVLKKMMAKQSGTVPTGKDAIPSGEKPEDLIESLQSQTKPTPQDSSSAGTSVLTFLSNMLQEQGGGNIEMGQRSDLTFMSFDERQTRRWKSVSQLEYFPVYPKQIKKWVTFTRTPRGFYDTNGRWVVLGDGTPHEQPADKVEAEKARRKMEIIFEEEQNKLPDYLKGRFRFGVEYDEIKNLGPKVKRLFSFTSATQKEIRKEQKKQAIIKWRKHENDTASSAIQVDVLTLRIRALIGHLQQNKQDNKNKRNLQLLIKRRRGLMRYLKKRDVPLYFSVLREIKLKDLYEVYNFNVR